jgi:mannose-6-phosphate isomerase
VEGAEIVYGHHATTKEEFQQLVEDGSWNQLLRKVKVKPGDFYYIPSGTIHAIGKGIMILETQQSSDITYRVYDYDRLDAEGNLRELHLEKSIAVANTPHEDATFERKTARKDGLIDDTLVIEDYFTVHHWELNGQVEKKTNGYYYLVSVLDGNGSFHTNEGIGTFMKPGARHHPEM